MARFGINPQGTLGVPMPTLRRLAKETGKDHVLARQLWDSGIHEARILTALVGEPAKMTEGEMERWVADFDSWDVCDQVCSNLFDRTPFAYGKAREWSRRKGEFERRAGYVLMAALAVHDKKAADGDFLPFLELIRAGATDERNFVRKAVNWALRQIGKRNSFLHARAIASANGIRALDSKSARWIAADALRELTSEKVKIRIVSRETNHRRPGK